MSLQYHLNPAFIVVIFCGLPHLPIYGEIILIWFTSLPNGKRAYQKNNYQIVTVFKVYWHVQRGVCACVCVHVKNLFLYISKLSLGCFMQVGFV